jgi:hypothetical protein
METKQEREIWKNGESNNNRHKKYQTHLRQRVAEWETVSGYRLEISAARKRDNIET